MKSKKIGKNRSSKNKNEKKKTSDAIKIVESTKGEKKNQKVKYYLNIYSLFTFCLSSS